jgi:hypothetical protein
LAAFDAAHVVPDEDNAALIYAGLLQGEEVPDHELAINVDRLLAVVQDPVSLQEGRALRRKLRELELSEGISDPNIAQAVGSRPWRSADCPELKLWLDGHRGRLDKLQEAARKPACRFPLHAAPGRLSLLDIPLGVLGQNALLLRYAANRDLGEGNIDDGIAKCRDLISIARHFREQPSVPCLPHGIVCEAMALHCLIEFVVEGSATQDHLRDLAVECERTNRDWESLSRDVNRVRDALSRLLHDERPIRFRMYMSYRRVLCGDHGWIEDRTRELYHRLLSERRGLRIVIELRRFKDRTGQWPESLEQIASALPSAVLVDPLSGGAYVYKRSERNFSLYSTGLNRIDEGGQHKWDGPDDWPLWPARGRGAEAQQRRGDG